MANKKDKSRESSKSRPGNAVKKNPSTKNKISKNIYQFEKLISGFSAALISTPEEGLEKELNSWLKKFAELLKVDRCIVNEFLEDEKTVHVLLNYTVPGIDVEPVVDTYQPPQGVIREFKKGIIVKAEKIPEDLPESFRGGIIEKTNTKSIIIAPLTVDKKVIGSLLFASYGKKRKWSDDLIRRIKLIGEIIANAIIRIGSHKSLNQEMERREALEKRYSVILKNSNVGFLISDLDQNILEVNDEYCRMSGYSRDELLKKKIWEIDASVNYDKVGKEAEGIDETRVRRLITSHIRKDGSLFDVEVSGNYFEEEGIVCTFIRDITELNKTKVQLEERLKFEELISDFSAALININPEDIYVVINNWLKEFVEFLKVGRGVVTEYLVDQDAARVLMQYTVPGIDAAPLDSSFQIKKKTMEEFRKGVLIKAEKIPEDLPPTFPRDFKSRSIIIVPLFSGNEAFGNLAFADYETERKWSDDLVRRIKLVGEIIANAILRVRSHENLIKETEQRKKLEDRYSSIIRNANIGFWISDKEQNILVVNDEYCRMSGYSRKEILSMKIPDIDISFGSGEGDITEEILGIGASHHEVTHIRRDGTLMDLDVSSSLLKRENLLFSFMRDITELNKTKKEQAERLRFEELASEFSAALINIAPENMYDELNKWLKKFVEFLQVDRGIVNEHLYDEDMIHLLLNYSIPGIDVDLMEYHRIPGGIREDFIRGLSVIAEKIPDDLPEGLRGGLVEKENAKSIIIVPIKAGNEVIGNLTFLNYRNERKWSDELVSRIKLIGEIIANAILRKRSHEALFAEMERRQMLEERYTSVIKNADLGFMVSDMNSIILDVNDAYCEMSGYSRDELIGMGVEKIDESLSAENELTPEKEEILKKTGLFIETTHRRKDGTFFDVALSSNFLEKEDLIFNFIRDITEANQAKKEQEERLKFEELVSEFSAALINIRIDDLVEELKKWTVKFVDFLEIGRGVVNEYDYDRNIMRALVNYTSPASVDATFPHDKDLAVSEKVMNEFKKGTMIRAEKIPEDLEAPFNEWIIEKHNTKSLAVVPLVSESRIIGNLTFASYIKARKWPDDIFNRIKLVGEIIANAILRMRAHEALNKAQRDLEERLEFEKVISEFSTALINIQPDDIADELGKWLEKFVGLIDADRAGVNEYQDNHKTIKNLIQYSVPGINIPIPDIRKTPEGEITELKKGIIIAEKIHEDHYPMFRGSFVEKSNAKSLIIVPLLTGNRIFGNLAFTNYRNERRWSEELIRRIRLIAEIVGNAVLRLRSHEALLEEMERRHMLEDRYSSIIKSANVGFMISDMDARILEVNDAYCEMSGYSRAELLNMKIYQLDISGNPEKVDNDKSGIFKTGAFHHETVHIRKDGKVVDVLISANLLQKEGLVCGFIRDVTELKIARKDLEDRLKFEELTAEFSAALINIDLDDINIELNLWLKKFVEFLEVDRGIAYEYIDDGKTIKSLMNYTNPDIEIDPPEEIMQVPPKVMDEFKNGVVVRSERIPDDLPVYLRGWVIEEHNTKSLIIVPLTAGNQILGNLTFACYRIERKWSDELVRRIKLIGEIIANAISRKRSSDALIEEMKRRQQLEERYSSIIKTANVGFWISDTDQNILVVNDEYCHMSGYSRDELLKMKIADIDSSKNYGEVDKIGADSVERGASHRERTHIRKDGTFFDVEISTNFLADEQLFFCFTRDITELNKAKKELEARLKFEELVSEFSAALINVKIQDIKNELNLWLRRFSELMDVDRSAIGQYEKDYSIFRFISTYSKPGLEPPPPSFPSTIINNEKYGLEKILMNGNFIKIESPDDETPHGLEIWKQKIVDEGTKSLLMLPLMGGDVLLGSMVMATLRHERIWTQEFIRRLKLVVEIFANALMRDKTDTELDNYRKHLEKMVEERTARLEEAQKELLVSEKMATLGRLTATVSHELRNPLGTIRSSVYSVHRRLKGQDEKVATALDRVERNIRRCDLIIDELLDYSRSRDLKLEPTPIDRWLSEVIEETGIPEGISINKELNANTVIDMDTERFRQSMVNILNNAYQSIQEKGTDEPGIVTMSTHRNAGNLIIEISDNGVGFDMEHKSKIFEPLYSTKTFGVGLGVPITRQIIEQHGWHMDITGEPQKGATVIITIPL